MHSWPLSMIAVSAQLLLHSETSNNAHRRKSGKSAASATLEICRESYPMKEIVAVAWIWTLCNALLFVTGGVLAVTREKTDVGNFSDLAASVLQVIGA